ncbi:hypothetical protein J7E91_28860 [Streptomyces sp. ISL-99]|nr:hypothetical protein [Streptomyces sp. ISL-99]MBT2529303.1 hypothetical protein [Streptomyces sp. ISL-99]
MRRTIRPGRPARAWIVVAVMALGALLTTAPGAASATDSPTWPPPATT